MTEENRSSHGEIICFFVPADRRQQPYVYEPNAVIGNSFVVPAFLRYLYPRMANAVVSHGYGDERICYAKSHRAPEVVPPDGDFDRLMRELQVLEARNMRKNEVFRGRALWCHAAFYPFTRNMREDLRQFIAERYPRATHAISPRKVEIVSW